MIPQVSSLKKHSSTSTYVKSPSLEEAFEKMRKLMKNSFLNTPCTVSEDRDAEITEEINRLTKGMGKL